MGRNIFPIKGLGQCPDTPYRSLAGDP
jgi:hypothetical protein